MDEGKRVPAEYYQRPDIRSDLFWLWRAIGELGTERQMGMGVGRIPWSKIRAYLIDELNLDGAEYDYAYAVIRAVDDDYVAFANQPKDQDFGEMAEIVKPDDTEGLKKMMRRLGARSQKRLPRK